MTEGTQPHSPGRFPWEQRPPETNVHGFCQVCGVVKVGLGYATYTGAVLLYAWVKVGSNKAQLWRNYWASKEGALRAANQLADDAMDYLDQYSPPRPAEDLDFDDFVEHLRMKLTNEFH